MDEKILIALGLASETEQDAAIGAIAALKLRADKADALEADLTKVTDELTKLKAEHIAEEKKSLIDAAILGGVAPAKRAELEALELSALKVCLSLLPKKAPAAVEPPVDDKKVVDAAALTPEQLKVLRLTGVTPEKFFEHQKVLRQIVNPSEEQ